jgi:hypothetical protein
VSARPNLFVVGAPRCGTTKLHEDLARHPRVFMSRRKEPHFFCTDVTAAYEAHQAHAPRHLLRDLESYLELFAQAGDARLVGESSVYYLYSDAALRGIRDFAPRAKIVILLREPVEFLHSLHGRLYSMADETQPFGRALALEPERRAGRSVPDTVRYPGLLFYSDYARFSERVRRWREVFPAEQVGVFLLDDMRASPEPTWNRILDFLELERVPLPADTPRNPTLEARSRWLAHWLRRRWLRGRWNRLDRRLERLNTRSARPRKLDPALVSELRERWRPEVEALARLLDRDLLSLWGYRSGV